MLLWSVEWNATFALQVRSLVFAGVTKASGHATRSAPLESTSSPTTCGAWLVPLAIPRLLSLIQATQPKPGTGEASVLPASLEDTPCWTPMHRLAAALPPGQMRHRTEQVCCYTATHAPQGILATISGPRGGTTAWVVQQVPFQARARNRASDARGGAIPLAKQQWVAHIMRPRRRTRIRVMYAPADGRRRRTYQHPR